jgi:hypothetical protein
MANLVKCPKCDKDKQSFDFGRDRGRKSGRSLWCKLCNNKRNTQWNKDNIEKVRKYQALWKSQNPEKMENFSLSSHLRRSYNIDIEGYKRLLSEQDDGCAICGTKKCRTGYRLAIDHDHMTGKIRGLLCQSCNIGIGGLKDDIELLKKALKYLEKHK